MSCTGMSDEHVYSIWAEAKGNKSKRAQEGRVSNKPSEAKRIGLPTWAIALISMFSNIVWDIER